MSTRVLKIAGASLVVISGALLAIGAAGAGVVVVAGGGV
jgi:hypothetical protein